MVPERITSRGTLVVQSQLWPANDLHVPPNWGERYESLSQVCGWEEQKEKNATMCRYRRWTGWSVLVSCTPSGSEEEEVVSAPKVADKKRKEQDNPNPRKVKLPKLDPVRSPSPEFEHQQKKKEKTGVQKGKKRLHHRREENLICKKEIYDILCHLWKHAEKVDIGANEVMHISSVAKRKGWRWSTSRVGTDIMWFSFARPINPCRSRRLHRPPQNQKQK